MSDYTNGKWHAATLGQFIAMLVDSGKDEAVLFQIMDSPPEDLGEFIRQMHIILLPQGQVVDWITAVKPESVENSLVELINAGVVK